MAPTEQRLFWHCINQYSHDHSSTSNIFGSFFLMRLKCWSAITHITLLIYIVSTWKMSESAFVGAICHSTLFHAKLKILWNCKFQQSCHLWHEVEKGKNITGWCWYWLKVGNFVYFAWLSLFFLFMTAWFFFFFHFFQFHNLLRVVWFYPFYLSGFTVIFH